MIIRAPLSKCPDCHYSFRGLPTAGRCPECGFHYDEHTVVMRPARFWKKFLTAAGLEALLFYFLGPPMLVLLGSFFPGTVSILILMVLALVILAMNALLLHKATKYGHFAAVTPKGIVVKNRTGEQWIAVKDISIFSKHDPVPWLKKRGIDRTISLKNLFDARNELVEFEQAIFGTGPKDSPPNKADDNASSREHPENQDAPPDQQKPGSRSRKSKKRGPAAIMTAIGVSLIAIGLLFMPLVALFLANDIKKTIVSVGVGVFWLGAAIALIGQWKSDPHSRKKNKQT